MTTEAPFFVELVGGRLDGRFVRLGRKQSIGKCRVSVQKQQDGSVLYISCWVSDGAVPINEFDIPIGEYEVGEGCKAILIEENNT